MGFHCEKTRKAYKDHVCDICNKTIKKGDKYLRKTGKGDYGMYSSTECFECQPIIAEYCNSQSYDGEGYCDEYIQEWWREVKCYECKHRYLPCAESKDAGCPTGATGDDKCCDYYTKYGTCRGGDTCDEMTRSSWCDKFEKMD